MAEPTKGRGTTTGRGERVRDGAGAKAHHCLKVSTVRLRFFASFTRSWPTTPSTCACSSAVRAVRGRTVGAISEAH